MHTVNITAILPQDSRIENATNPANHVIKYYDMRLNMSTIHPCGATTNYDKDGNPFITLTFKSPLDANAIHEAVFGDDPQVMMRISYVGNELIPISIH